MLAALGAWLPLLHDVPSSVTARISEGFKERDALRRANLRALLEARSLPSPPGTANLSTGTNNHACHFSYAHARSAAVYEEAGGSKEE